MVGGQTPRLIPTRQLINLHPDKYYAEGLLREITTNQSLTLSTSNGNGVASTGLFRCLRAYTILNYHWSATRIGFGLDTKIQEYDATGGNDIATGTDPSLRRKALPISPSIPTLSPRNSTHPDLCPERRNNELYTLPPPSNPAIAITPNRSFRWVCFTSSDLETFGTKRNLMESGRNWADQIFCIV